MLYILLSRLLQAADVSMNAVTVPRVHLQNTLPRNVAYLPLQLYISCPRGQLSSGPTREQLQPGASSMPGLMLLDCSVQVSCDAQPVRFVQPRLQASLVF